MCNIPLVMLEPEMESKDESLGPLLTPMGIRPAFVGKELAAEYLGQSTALVDRMLWATRHTDDKWLEIVANQAGDPKQRTWISTRSVERAAVRMAKGESPPKITKMAFIGRLWNFFTGRTEAPLPVQTHTEAEKALAREFAAQQQKETAAALEAEKQKFRSEAATKLEDDEPRVIIVDPNLFPEEK